jgi:hypothetical protein
MTYNNTFFITEVNRLLNKQISDNQINIEISFMFIQTLIYLIFTLFIKHINTKFNDKLLFDITEVSNNILLCLLANKQFQLIFENNKYLLKNNLNNNDSNDIIKQIKK